MGLQRFPISDFRGGLNTKEGPFDLDTNEAQDLLNVTLTRRGILQQRRGKARFDTGSLPGPIQHMRAWYPVGGSRRLYLSIDGDIYYLSTGGILSARVFDGTAGTTWHFESALDGAGVPFLWCMNGVDAPQKINAAGTAAAWANSPPNGTMLRLWKNKMCIAGVASAPQRLFVSDTGNPESPAATYGTSWTDIKSTEDDLDPISWTEILGDLHIVFKKGSVWAVTHPITLDNHRIGAPGCEDRFMSAVQRGKAYFFNKQGLWSTDGIQEPRLESEKIENLITDNMNYSAVTTARVFTSRDRRVFVALPFGSSSTPNRLLELIPDSVYLRRGNRFGGLGSWLGAWCVHDLTVSAVANFRPSNTDIIVAADSTSAKTHTLFSGLNDDGVAISAYWKSGWKSLIEEEPYERLRRINLEMSGQLVLDVYQDFGDSSRFSKAMSVPADADPFWDGGIWDGGTWDPATVAALVRARPETRGRFHAVKFSNNVLDKTFTVYAAELALRGGKEH